jgi:hypothetical protein
MIRTSRKPLNSSTESFKFFDEGRNECQIADCLNIKGLDNQTQMLNYQINQYPPKSLIVNLVRDALGACGLNLGGRLGQGERKGVTLIVV